MPLTGPPQITPISLIKQTGGIYTKTSIKSSRNTDKLSHV